jgi:Flp pilus assembly protein CpaB
MRRSPRVWMAWMLAVLVGFITVRVVMGDLGALHRRARTLGPDVRVVVATRDLPIGARIDRTDLHALVRPRSTVTADAIHDPAIASGRVVAVPLLRDDVVRAAHLTAPDRNTLDGVVPFDRRAVHIIVKDGFRPPDGAIVDVLASFDPASLIALGARGRAAIVAAGAQVLALDDGPESGGPTGTGVTLLVTVAEAPAVAFAAANGDVTVALAPPEHACCTSSTR